jgi:hypothetical protein
LNAIIQELRKDNQALKQVNYELEMNTRNNSLSEDKVKYFINLDESSQ